MVIASTLSLQGISTAPGATATTMTRLKPAKHTMSTKVSPASSNANDSRSRPSQEEVETNTMATSTVVERA
eukprot:scaffold265877_cov32-Tisochrysis_lutea.AAC.1